MSSRWPVWLALGLSLDACSDDRWQVRESQPGSYELTHVGSDRPAAIRPEFERRATTVCHHGYQMSEPQVVAEGWHGNAVFGEGPTWTVRAELRCNP